MERELAEAVEVTPGRFYWLALHSMPKNTAKSHYFSIDMEFVYEPFFADFGPLNLSSVCSYCRLLDAKFKDPALADKRIIHFCSHDPKKRANAAFLVGAYRVVVLGKSADSAYEPFCDIYPPFLPFRDAIMGVCSFQCTILDCLKGLEFAIGLKWFDWNHFDVETYDFFERVENGDMNWIVPDKFLAFAGPCPTPTDADGFPAFTPEDYVPIFKDADIRLIVRLNKKQYDRRRFIDHALKHVDLYFLDGSCPPPEIIAKFLHIVENEPGAIAVHCKAGLGRTGCLIGLYSMKHFQFPARAFIGWNRICRPGSMLGPQQQFMVDMEKEMFEAGASFRGSQRTLQGDSDRAMAAQIERLSLRERSQGEQVEDVGQGERLCGAKRVVDGGRNTNGSPTDTGAGRDRLGSGGRPLGRPSSGGNRRSLKGIHSC